MEAIWKALKSLKKETLRLFSWVPQAQVCREEIPSVFDKYPPAIISTRDSYSYERIKDLCEFTYVGLDSAFIKDAYTPQVDYPLLRIFNDRWEPNVKFGQSGAKHSFGFGDLKWGLDVPSVQQYFSKGKAWAYLGHLLDRQIACRDQCSC